MQNARKIDYGSRVAVFPSKAAVGKALPDRREQFERMLIFVLFTLWALGMVAWTLVSVVGLSPGGAHSNVLDSLAMPSTMPTVQSAAMVVIRLVLGF
jgi:hypothetical protein